MKWHTSFLRLILSFQSLVVIDEFYIIDQCKLTFSWLPPCSDSRPIQVGGNHFRTPSPNNPIAAVRNTFIERRSKSSNSVWRTLLNKPVEVHTCAIPALGDVLPLKLPDDIGISIDAKRDRFQNSLRTLCFGHCVRFF